MRRTLLACALGSLLCCGPAVAAPGADEASTVHVNAIRNPELHKYEAILAGLDSFDKHHALAPKVPALRFRIETRLGASLPEQPKVKIEGEHDFVLPLALDADNRFSVPRSEAARDAGGELVLNQKRSYYRVVPEVRTPGLADNVRRLGDLRLECKVMISIAKEEIPLFWVLTLNGILMTRDWCSFFSGKERSATFAFKTDRPILGAVLREGERKLELKTQEKEFSIGLADAEWSDEALVELSFSAPVAVQAPVTGTAAETPRTAP